MFAIAIAIAVSQASLCCLFGFSTMHMSMPKCSDYKGSDAVGGCQDDSVMVDKRAKKGGMNYCAAAGPNKVKAHLKGYQ